MATESEKDLGDTAGAAPVTSTDNEAKTKKEKEKGTIVKNVEQSIWFTQR